MVWKKGVTRRCLFSISSYGKYTALVDAPADEKKSREIRVGEWEKKIVNALTRNRKTSQKTPTGKRKKKTNERVAKSSING
jgi:hypothetical protein